MTKRLRPMLLASVVIVLLVVLFATGVSAGTENEDTNGQLAGEDSGLHNGVQEGLHTDNRDHSIVYKFQFTNGEPSPGYTKVAADTDYLKARGFGFTDVTQVKYVDNEGKDPIHSQFAIFNKTAFNVDLPPGEYEVNLWFGNYSHLTRMGMKAEDNLLVAASLGAAAGQLGRGSFEVKVTDGQLNLQQVATSRIFYPALNAMEIRQIPDSVLHKPTIYIAGDSTVADYGPGGAPWAGWGQMLPFFLSSDVVVKDYAVPGRSVKSFADEGSLNAILNVIKPGDYLFIEFGINDANKADPALYAAPDTTYKTYLQQYIDEARARQAIPVLVTPQERRSYADGQFKPTAGLTIYANSMKDVGTSNHTPIIDLNAKSIAWLQTLTYEKSEQYFMWADPGVYRAFPNGLANNLHFSPRGATKLAHLVAEGIKEQIPDIPLLP